MMHASTYTRKKKQNIEDLEFFQGVTLKKILRVELFMHTSGHFSFTPRDQIIIFIFFFIINDPL